MISAPPEMIDFRSMKTTTQTVYRKIIEKLCRETDKTGQPYSDKSVVTLRREHIVKLMTARAERPDSANGLRKALRAMMKHAVEAGLRDDDPTRDVRAIRVKTGGYQRAGQRTRFQNSRLDPGRLARSSGPRPLLYTGQRRSDVVRMGRQHIRNGALQVRQMKTGTELTIPVHATLAGIIAETPTDNLTFLMPQFGEPFTAAGFGNWFREQFDSAGPPHCSAHGLRKAAARRLAEAGCIEHEIAAITGHASLREIARYTKAADQKRFAESAMSKVSANPE
jgi:integrase